MRILAIRGQDLTSLAGEFALELDQPPLDKLGLFAITGATGSGKSTLLDAMCLALFDRTPRLEGHVGVAVGRPGEDKEERLLSHDVRGLLRRGAAEGYAEVDFLGSDGRRYRSRWSVRRARKKSDGRLQFQELTLTDVATGQTFGRTKSEVLKAIEQRLGLSFDQFRRSALLAQGEFAAFLRANSNERAELLERMTGTEIYSRVSIAAHERNKKEQEELTRMEAGLAAISRLSDEERAAVEGALKTEEEARAAAEKVLAEASASVEWYATRAKFVASEREAVEGLARAAEAVEAAAPREATLARVRAAEVFRAPVATIESKERVLAEASAAQVRLAAEAEKALAAAGARQTELGQTERARTAALAAEESAGPALTEAAQLDAQLAVERQKATEASQRAAASRTAEEQAVKALAAIAGQEAAAKSAAEAARTWLAGHSPLEVLAREWPRWEAELGRYERAAVGEQQAKADVARLSKEELKLREAAELRRQERQKASEAMEQAQARATHAETAVGVDAGAARRELRKSLLARQDALRTLGKAQEGVAAAATAEQEARTEAEAAQREAETAAAEAQQVVAHRSALEAGLKEAKRALAQAQSAQDLASHRAELREGEPCPLCGATAHPYRAAEAALNTLVVGASARVESLEAERTAATQKEAAALARQKAAQPRQAQAETRRTQAASKREAHREAWTKARALLQQPLPPEQAEDSGARAWLDEALKEAEARLAAVNAEEEAAETRARAAREARAALEVCRDRLEATSEALRLAETAFTVAERSLRESERQADQQGIARRQVLTDLAPAFTGWREWEARLAADPGGFRKYCAAHVADWNTHDEAFRNAQAREAKAREDRAAAEARKETQRETAEADAHAWKRADEALRQTQAARAKVLEGRSVEQVRTLLRTAVESTTQSYEKARAASESASRAAAVATARAEEAAKARTAAAEAREQAQAALDALLQGRGVTWDDVRELLAKDAAWCETEARALAGLREAHAKARTVLEERQAWRSKHEASGAPALPEPEVAATRERARAEVEAHRAAAAGSKARLDQDDEARKRYGAEAQALEERRRAAEVWKTLHELIGSADGKKFKVFAQSLTLDALLLHANAHLEELARRYRLMRVPGYDLDLQVVDQDMGDEMRGLASLSGGESFLVSLALALGLASLSSETTQVETLFIDEGFGTLDPETLEVALATLDALQATGRQVGIISHVSGMAERIGAQVRVVKQGGGRSRLVVQVDGGLAALPEPPASGSGNGRRVA